MKRWRDFTKLAMRPARQRLEGDDFTCFEIDDRLIPGTQAVRANGCSKLALHGVPLSHVTIHLFFEKMDGGNRLGLGFIERDIGFAQEFFRPIRIARVHGDAYAEAHFVLVGLESDGFFQS
jgi:hypothetical protein